VEWRHGDAQAADGDSVKRWEHNHHSVSVSYGPLTFSLKIGERYERHDSTETAIGDSKWQKGADPTKWPSHEIHPTTPWNYGLVNRRAAFTAGEIPFTVHHGDWPADDFPFFVDAAPLIPVRLEREGEADPRVDARPKPMGCARFCRTARCFPMNRWKRSRLIPMGAARRMRISAFPVIGPVKRRITPLEEGFRLVRLPPKPKQKPIPSP
jgi:hypothetical protein